MVKKIIHPYEELKRYLMGFTLFCFGVAVVGMAATGCRVFTVAWGGAAVIVSLQALSRIIIWCLSSWNGVKRGAQETKKTS
jgi:hypothetical protein